MSRFTLIPFDKNAASNLEVTGKIERHDNQLKIAYQLEKIQAVILPPAANRPTRIFDLWEHTCFELFVGLQDSSKYWEFNFSPSGNWNVFRFQNYRLNISEEMAFNKLPFEVSQQDSYLQTIATIDLNKIIAPQQGLAVGITAVVENKQEQLSYWALSHPGKAADFHLRDSFIINLDLA